MEENTQQNNTFSETELQNFVAFSDVLARIHKRLAAEGYEIKDGQLVKRPSQKH